MSLGKYNYKLQFCSCEGMYFKGRVYNSKIHKRKISAYFERGQIFLTLNNFHISFLLCMMTDMLNKYLICYLIEESLNLILSTTNKIDFRFSKGNKYPVEKQCI